MLRAVLLGTLALAARRLRTVQVDRGPARRRSRSTRPSRRHATWRATTPRSRGQAKQRQRARIERLLAGLDNATLARDAAALPAGDPLYLLAGRALLQSRPAVAASVRSRRAGISTPAIARPPNATAIARR